MRDTQEAQAPYLIFMLALSVLGLLLLGAGVALPLTAETRQILDYADDVLCLLFFIDFIHSMWRAENKWRYFIQWGWIDLLSCIPSIDYLRAGRAARIVRVFRVLRAIRSARIIASFILQRRAQGAMLAATLTGMLLILLASIGILHLEDVPEANIKSAEDALWWTMETITTVGYGDKYPVTSEGRLLASGLMLAGVALIGIYTGYVASWFLRPAEADEGDRASRIDSLADALLRLSNDERAGLAVRLGQVRDLVGPTP